MHHSLFLRLCYSHKIECFCFKFYANLILRGAGFFHNHTNLFVAFPYNLCYPHEQSCVVVKKSEMILASENLATLKKRVFQTTLNLSNFLRKPSQ